MKKNCLNVCSVKWLPIENNINIAGGGIVNNKYKFWSDHTSGKLKYEKSKMLERNLITL